MRLGDKELALLPGTATLSPAGVASAYHLASPGHHDCIHFQTLPARGRCAAVPICISLGDNQHYARQQMQQIISFWRVSGQSPAVSAMLQALLLWLAHHGQSAKSHAPVSSRVEKAVQTAADWMEQHLDQPITVPEVAAAVGLSQNYLAVNFRKRFNMTLPHYLLTRRIAVAQDLLRQTSLPVSHIAARVGIADAQHFNKQFSRITNTNPTTWRGQSTAQR